MIHSDPWQPYPDFELERLCRTLNIPATVQPDQFEVWENEGGSIRPVDLATSDSVLELHRSLVEIRMMIAGHPDFMVATFGE